VTIRFLHIAEIELDEAIHWYASQAPGLGNAFLIEALSAVDRVSLYPAAPVLKVASPPAHAQAPH
jgi:toxin ParE2